jgi:hypothetical protein
MQLAPHVLLYPSGGCPYYVASMSIDVNYYQSINLRKCELRNGIDELRLYDYSAIFSFLRENKLINNNNTECEEL